MMKLLAIVLLTTICFFARADMAPYTEVNEFSEWFYFEGIRDVIDKCPDSKYPAVIQAGALLGDGVAFRVLFLNKPAKDFDYKFVLRASPREFEELNSSYKKAGFTLSFKQVVQLRAVEAHQAVWVK